MTGFRRVTVHALPLDAALVGRALAPPWRRGMALLVDAAVLLLPSLAIAAGAAALSLRSSDPAAWTALRTLIVEQPAADHAAVLMADLAPLLVEIDAPGLPVDLAYAVEHGDRQRVEALMASTDFVIALGNADPRSGAVVVPVERLIPAGARTLALLGVPALYFTLAHRGRRGVTLGKRLMGISVRRLDGTSLGLLDSLERFGGYFAVAGTVGIGLVELWRHPLRQLAHDRGAGTVVVLERGGAVALGPPPGRGGAVAPAGAPPSPAEPPAGEREPAGTARGRGKRTSRRRRRRRG